MAGNSHQIKFRGSVLSRGFWLYVWEVKPRRRKRVYYVGRTGDSSTLNAQSVFSRMSQHLGFAENSCMLRRCLVKRGIRPEGCSFRLIAYGPVLREIGTKLEYRRRRDKVAAVEKELQRAMERVGYDVLNE